MKINSKLQCYLYVIVICVLLQNAEKFESSITACATLAIIVKILVIQSKRLICSFTFTTSINLVWRVSVSYFSYLIYKIISKCLRYQTSQIFNVILCDLHTRSWRNERSLKGPSNWKESSRIPWHRFLLPALVVMPCNTKKKKINVLGNF